MAVRKRGTGLILLALALLGVPVLAGPAVAQEPEEVEVAIDQQALLAYPANDVIPDTLLSAFPPQVVCVVFPQACPEELQPVREPIAGALGEVDANEQTLPIQLASPDGITIAYLGGTPRYATAAAFELPNIPEGHEFDQFVVEFQQTDPSYSFASPAFRRAVMAAVQTVGSQNPETFVEQLSKLQEEAPIEEPLLGIEACPLTQPMPEDAAPPQSAPISSISTENADGEQVPAIDCLYGANGQFEEGTWSFDLSSAAKAWSDGTLQNHGILLRPTGAPNLAFGDPDTSTNAQVVLDASQPASATVSSSEPAPPVATLGSMDPTSGSMGSTAPRESTISSPPSSQMGNPGPIGGDSAPAAEVAAPETSTSQGQAEQPSVALDATPASTPSTPWYVWMLVPVFGAGMWLVSRSLTEELVVAGARRGGALTRLVEGSTA